MGKTSRKRSKAEPAAPQGMYAVDGTLPSDEQAERAVLGGVLLDNTQFFHAVAAGLCLDDFFLDSHRRIFLALQGMIRDGKVADIVTVMDYVGAHNEVEAIGGIAYLSSLTTGFLNRPHILPYLDILSEKRLRRQAVFLANRTMAMALDPAEPPRLTLEALSEDSLALQGRAARHLGAPVSDYSDTVVAKLEEIYLDGREVIGLPFGIRELDEMTTGMRTSELVVVGGFAGSGKTSFGLTVLMNNAEKGTPGVLFSVEMPKEDVIVRILSRLSDIPHVKLRNPRNLVRQEIADLKHFSKKLAEMPVIIDDDNTLTPAELFARARLYIAKYNAKLIVVDYLQIIQTSSEDDEYTQVSKTADTLMRLARATGVPVLALSQLTRPEKKNLNMRPNIAMLRSSGKIEQNANLVLFTYHPYDEGKEEYTRDDHIIIGKQRAGVMGKVKASYDPRVLRWEERIEQPIQQAELKLSDKTNGKAAAAAAGSGGGNQHELRPEQGITGDVTDDDRDW